MGGSPGQPDHRKMLKMLKNEPLIAAIGADTAEKCTIEIRSGPVAPARAARLAGRALELHLQVEEMREQQQVEERTLPQRPSQAAAQAATAAAQRLQRRKERVQQEAITT